MSDKVIQRFLINTSVKDASGTQTWYVDAESWEEALVKFDGAGGNLYESEVEVTDLGEPEPAGTTTLDDYGSCGDYPEGYEPPEKKVDLRPVTDEEIVEQFHGKNFGHNKHRELLNASVLKRLVGYHCGHTITEIMRAMGLVDQEGTPTQRGILLVREAYGHLMRI